MPHTVHPDTKAPKSHKDVKQKAGQNKNTGKTDQKQAAKTQGKGGAQVIPPKSSDIKGHPEKGEKVADKGKKDLPEKGKKVADKGKKDLPEKGKKVADKGKKDLPEKRKTVTDKGKKDLPAKGEKVTDKGKKEPPEKGNKVTDKGQKVDDQEKDNLRGNEGKKIFSQRIISSLQPVRWFCLLTGNFPWSFKTNLDGSSTFTFSWFSLKGLYFFLISCFSFYSFFVGTWNFGVHVLDIKIGNSKSDENSNPDFILERYLEKALLKRHLMWLFSMIASVIHCCICSLHIFQKRHYIASVYTFYTKVVQHMHLDITKGVVMSTATMIMVYVCTMLLIISMGSIRFGQSTTGAPTLFGVYLYRLFVNEQGLWIDRETKARHFVQTAGSVSLILIYSASKAQILLFIYHCKILKNAFAAWNGRCYVTMMKAGKYFYTEEGRLTFHVIYKDHCTLLDMLEGVNRTFATIIESYYALQMATIFFEIYFFIRVSKHGGDTIDALNKDGYFIRPNDWLPGLLLTLQSIILALATSKIASDVGEEAMCGVDIVRRKVLIYRKTDDTLYFQLSMQASFNAFHRFDVGGGGYYYLNKDWILGYVNNFMGYFIILYQFQPVMDESTAKNWTMRPIVGRFLTNLEKLRVDHWQSTPVPPPAVYFNSNS